jgi:hypothetical protein
LDTYIFTSATATAFTIDPTGLNLPDSPGPWQYIRKAGEGELRGREIEELMHPLQAQGYAVINLTAQRRPHARFRLAR